MRCATTRLKIILLVMQAEGINKAAREVLFVLATDAVEQISYCNNTTHMLVQTKRPSRPRLSELVHLSDAISQGRVLFFLYDVFSVPDTLSVPQTRSQATWALNWTYSKDGSCLFHSLLMWYLLWPWMTFGVQTRQIGFCFTFHFSFQNRLSWTCHHFLLEFYILPLSFTSLPQIWSGKDWPCPWGKLSSYTQLKFKERRPWSCILTHNPMRLLHFFLAQLMWPVNKSPFPTSGLPTHSHQHEE